MRCFLGFVRPVLEYCSAEWCSAADTDMLLDRVVSGACFFADGVLECYLSHCRSVAVLCRLYKMRSNPIHPLYGGWIHPLLCQCGLRVRGRGAFVDHRYSYAPRRCGSSNHRKTFINHLVSLWNYLVDSLFDGVGLAGFKSRQNAYLLT